MSQIVIAGDTSGTVTIRAPDVAGSTVLTLPIGSNTTLMGGTFATNTAVLFADSGIANGTSGFTFNKASNNVTFANSMVYGGVTLSNSVTGTGSMVLSASPTLTGTATFNGNSSSIAAILSSAGETINVSATAATGTINYDVTSQNVLYYTTNATANWTVNFRASSGTTLNNAMTIGQVVTATFLVSQGATPYYNSLIQVDGANTTAKWQGGIAPTAGNANSVDGYVYSIIKTANTTFTILASQTQFK